MKKQRLTLMLAWLLTGMNALASVLFYDDDRLSSNMITDICQDHQGYIWIATEYGLNKFDGVNMTQYFCDEATETSLSDNIVRHVLTDRRGALWVVSNLGVQRYNRLTDAFDNVIFDEGKTANINDITETGDGHIWLLSAGHGIYEIDEDLKALPLESLNKHIDRNDQADNFYIDRKGRLWIAYHQSLQVIDPESGKAWNCEEQLQPDNRAVDIIEDAEGKLLVLTYASIMQLNERTKGLETLVSYPRNDMTRFFKDAAGRLLAGTNGSGLWMVNVESRQISRFSGIDTQEVDPGQAKVFTYLEDRDGNRWVGCTQKGLLFVSQKPNPFHFIPLNRLPSDNGNTLRALAADSEENVYVCQEEGGIAVISPSGQLLHQWMKGYTVMAICPDRDGQLLAGTYRDGLFRIDPRTGREQQLTRGQRIGSITLDSKGNIYTAVFNDGLHSYTPDGKTERLLCKGRLKLTNPYLNRLFTARDGKIWIGHYYGVDVYDPQTDSMVDVSIHEALRPAIVYTIEQSPRDRSIWVGTNKGLFQYHTRGTAKGTWKRFTTKNGLPNDIVCGIVVTDDGTLWASTYRGLAEIDADGTFTSYYRGNGLQEWSYLRGVYTWTGIDEVLLGNLGGITYFNPSKIAKNEFRSSPVLTGMKLGDDNVNAQTRSNGKKIIDVPIDQTDAVTVSYVDNTFSLSFSTMDFRDPENVHYEYRFSDEPKDTWHKTQAGVPEIYFTHLSKGSHLLQVRAYENGIYSPVKELKLVVLPPWYNSRGAYFFLSLILLAMAALWWRYFWIRRKAELNEEKIKFFVDISHELRSPLTLIKSPVEQLLLKAKDPQITRALRNIERNTNRLLTLTNQILSIRKIEKGQMKMHFAETLLGEFVEGIVHDYDYRAEMSRVKLTFDNQAPDMKVWIDCEHFDKVVANLIGNAMKYVTENGEISVVLTKNTDGMAQLTVRDDGPGIDEAQLNRVFDRFYQATVRSAPGQMSYGIGLNLTHKIIMLHKGSITARNRTDGHGAEFTVRLKLGNGHLSGEQLVDGSYFAAAPDTGEPIPIATDMNKPRRQRAKTNYTVAVVDDDEEIRTFLQTELGESYRIRTYADGKSALEGIVDSVPDLVVSDVVMPGVDGVELLKRLKSSTTTSHIPVILLTSKAEHQSRIEGLSSGADAYVQKPFNLEELEVCISSLIANRIRMKGKFSGVQEQQETVRQIEMKGNDAILMEKIMKAVNDRLDDDTFNVEALAEEVGLSRVQLHRRVKELTGITVGEFIRNIRLKQAAKLLAKGDITVAQVTYAVGFANPTHFSAAFKKHYGVTPSEYIQKHQSGE